MREAISTPRAAKPIGPYSQAIKANGFVFVSGQTPFIPETGEVIAGDVVVQTDRALKNIAAILEAAGSSMQKVVRAGVFLNNMGDFAKMNEVYARYMPPPPPARTTIEAA